MICRIRVFRDARSGRTFEVVSDEQHLPSLRRRLVQERGCEPDWEDESIYEHQVGLDIKFPGEHAKLAIRELRPAANWNSP